MKTEYLLAQEVERVLSALTPSNRLVMRTCLHTGLRVSDVLSLKTVSLRPQFWMVESKTGKRRRVNLPRHLLDDLRAHAGAHEYVFPGRDGSGHRTRQAVWKDVKRAAKAFRMPQNIGIHSARKVYAVRLMERYGDIRRVQRALNHGSPSVTIIYAMADKLLTAKYKRRRRSER